MQLHMSQCCNINLYMYVSQLVTYGNEEEKCDSGIINRVTVGKVACLSVTDATNNHFPRSS